MKKQRKLSFLLVFLLCLSLTSQTFAQQEEITGTVTDVESGEGIPGVSILIKGTTRGAITDLDGSFSITAGSEEVLVFSFLGYDTVEQPIANRSIINISLSPNVQALNEVVVVGYGTQERKEITSAVTSVKAEDFNQGTVNDPRQLLQGKVAGLNIARPGGNPNGGFNMRLRGISSIGENAEPLVVIDGVIGGSLSTVDPNDIESMDVLKDGSAAAIYGTRGSAGVILVTTKTGKTGRTVVEFNSSAAVENVARTISVMNAEEYKQIPGSIDHGSSTDWFDEVTNTGLSFINNLSLGGGTATTNYRLSVNSRKVDGVGINSGFDQLNARINLTQKALKDKAIFTVNVSNTTIDRRFGNENSFRYAIITNPTLPVRSSLPVDVEFGGYKELDIFDWFNPVSIAEQNIADGRDSKLLASIRGEYNFTSKFRGAVFYASQRETEFRGNYSPKTAKFGGGYGRNGLASVRNNTFMNELFESTLHYDTDAGKVAMAFLGGYSYQEFFNQGSFVQAGNFLTDAFTYNNMNAALDRENGLASLESFANSNKLVAFFGRANFNLDDTYLLSVSARYEGSTRFGANNKWGLFPAISGGINIANLVDMPGVSAMKFRASYGRTGTQPNSSYISLLRFGKGNNFLYDGSFVPSYGPVSNANPDLAWETKDEYNVGLDFVILNNRLDGAIDYYTRITTGMILPINVPIPPNLFRTTQLNIGEMSNSGLEVMLNYKAINKSDFRWTTGVNFSTLRTNLRSLSTDDLSFGEVNYRSNFGSPGQNLTQLIRIQENGPLGQIWGPIQVGVSETGAPIMKVIDGTAVDDNGDPVYCNCDLDRAQLGTAYPTFNFGFNNNFNYKNWDLNFFFRGSIGHSLINSYRGFYENTETTTVQNWNIVNTKYFDPAITKAEYNSTHVEKADFVVLDNATLGYNFNVGSGKTIGKIRTFISVQNPFMFTGYTGVDPEVRYGDSESGNDPLAPGIERRATYFTTTITTFGLNLSF
ncbi:SusC/RagA family TonB-linked outer membrane protein [Algoriphagus sp. D3-2-R+10]|uniref:SusC/RagA family TonB-linked outer membrane protein n=1 Tax=Algoriphagus aurantiacus TaxID=3103948 RepID=UPI002B398295|nr:SusC/RagA family TonB-linked outer membrane protein [Algoriphagus sp. D3-2-R+10]MEB2775663.1 SusC/RagA family TonB-linked outer membrane protein [Algoriphagus sp. D3-2-R+10]